MELKNMSVAELEARKMEISGMVDTEDADLDALTEEVRAINAEIEARKNAEAKKEEIRSLVVEGKGEEVETINSVEERKMENMEIRNSKDYIDAFANYVKTNDDSECRALLTENVSGSVPVPELVYDIVKTAWDREELMRLVKKTYLKGNLKVGFEISGDGAVVHTEGQNAPNEENLYLGVVNLIPASIKKWIKISDEAMDLRGSAFLQFIYDELTYEIARKAADEMVAKIMACGTVSTSTCPGVPAITEATLGLGTIAKAMSELSDRAANPVILMNKKTFAAFKAAQYAASYPVDPFEGLRPVFNSTITAYSAASTGDTYAIVGDLGEGALANFPNGEEIQIKFDDLSLAEADLVKIVGREYVALGVVAPNAFVKIKK